MVALADCNSFFASVERAFHPGLKNRPVCVLSSNDGEVRLSGKELQLLEMFLREPGQVLPREMLHQKVWGAGRDATYNNIEVYLTLVRRKLRAVGSKAELISERGIGYYLQEAE